MMSYIEREITLACDAACTCGGRGPHDNPCPACDMYHRTIGNFHFREGLENELAKACQAALGEAAKIADVYSADAIGEHIALRIRALISAACPHASQQPHAVDLASAPLRPNH